MYEQISVRALREQFPKVLAVDGVDLAVAKGEVFGLLGPNGAGKTTTLEMIEGLTPADAGTIEISGLNWKENAPAIRALIGVQLQATSLYNKITPKEALDLFGSYYALPPRASRRAARIRAEAGMSESHVVSFRRLHEAGCFVLPNPWDAGSAVLLERLGFKALATTSSGFAFTKGLPDGADAVPLDAALAHVREIAAATSLPVNADFQNGYADDPEGVAANVALCVATGAAGLSIEDATGDPAAPLYETRLAVERIRAARRAIDASGVPVVLTARCEAWLVEHPDAERVALERLALFADAGADCLYAPRVSRLEDVAAIVNAVAPKPVNVLVAAASRDLTVARLADLGVRRISVGSALSRVAWGAFLRAARSIAETGTFDTFADAVPFAELNGAFGRRRS